MNELKGIKTEKKKSLNKNNKVERKLWKYILFTLLFGVDFKHM